MILLVNCFLEAFAICYHCYVIGHLSQVALFLFPDWRGIIVIGEDAITKSLGL